MSDVARRYARALYQSNVTPVTEADFESICTEILECKPLWEILRDPVIHYADKTAVLNALPFLSVRTDVLRLFCILAEKHRLPLIPDIMGAYHGLAINERHVADCTIRSARPLSGEQRAHLRAFLCKEHGVKDIFFKQIIDESLLGGFILNIMGITYDQSVRGRYEALARHLSEVNTL